MSESITDLVKDALHVLNIWKTEVIFMMRRESPVKVVHQVTVAANGSIGSGLDDWSNPEPVWQCPTAFEAWLHRISITSPHHGPAAPLTTGELLLFGSQGGVILWTPQPGLQTNVVPEQFVEGHASAPHLSSGEWLYLLGDQLPAAVSIRIDLQVNLVAGVSSGTPKPFVGTTSGTTTGNGS